MIQAESILEQLPCGCIVFNENGTITYANHMVCTVLGYKREDLLGQSVEIMLTLSSRIFYQTHFFPLLKLNEQVSEIFLTLRSESGRPVPMMVNAKLTSESAQPGYVCVFSPIWERQKYEQQLLEINRAQQKALQENKLLIQLREQLELNQFELDRKISILQRRSEEYLQMGKVFMHDVQEPIRKISLFFDSYLRTSGNPQNANEIRHLTVISKSIQRLKFLMGSLLDFVQISSDEGAVTLIKTADLISQANTQLIKENKYDGIELILGDIPEFEGRAAQIKRVFFELLKNAAQNKDPNRALRIAVSAVVTEENAYQNHLSKYRYTDHIKIEFNDNGTGFDSRFEDYVFGLLNKLNAGSGGPGLGLALCRQIISHHYGTIKAKSIIGEGTTVIIVLPLRQAPEFNIYT
ncbi:ATP-binding protein [Dyadobacter sp. CY356]|uniref:PAS domain-containing sensor histidine kinase n=1 Tax=Dyadobacter sp. CY356 TaxID=2906442 RepID=UPI001F1FE94B|nr:ATP-binding protein [Dyadobacter sp. CY356]MCF0055216.1 PAS domain S-box protein [Dyadobacter sp. CY356]